MLFLLFPLMAAHAGEADVAKVEVRSTGANTYEFDVTVSHDDKGWDHYADKWDVVTMDDVILGTRTLYHPHVEEQPFTRSLSGVTISGGIRKVRVRAHDSVHGYGGSEVTVELSQ